MPGLFYFRFLNEACDVEASKQGWDCGFKASLSTSIGNLYKTWDRLTANPMYYWMVPNTLVPHSQALACTSMMMHDLQQPTNTSKPPHATQLRPSASNPEHDLKFIHAVYRALMKQHREEVCSFWKHFSERGPEQNKIREAVFLHKSLSFTFDPLRKFFFKREKETESFEIFHVLDKIVSKQYGDAEHDPRVRDLLKKIDIFLKSAHKNAEIPKFEELDKYMGQAFMEKDKTEEILVKSLPTVVFLISASKQCAYLDVGMNYGKKCTETLEDMEETTKKMHAELSRLDEIRDYLSRMFFILTTVGLKCLESLQGKIRDGDDVPLIFNRSQGIESTLSV